MKRFGLFLLVLSFALVTLIGCGSKTVKTPLAAEYCVGKNYMSVESSFAGAGFTNISKKALEDLELTELSKDGTIKQVFIDGRNDYPKGEVFSPGSMIVMEYHSVKRVFSPISSDDAKNEDIDQLTQLFMDAGFDRVKVKEVYDLDPDTFAGDFENGLSIDGISIFDTDDKFPMNANIFIIHHLPYIKYTVEVHVEFMSNLFFSKYDVNFLLDGKKHHKLGHGIDADYTFRLTEGKYTFAFESVDSSSVKGEKTIVLNSDQEIYYKISCRSDKVDIEDITESVIAKKQEQKEEEERKAAEEAAAEIAKELEVQLEEKLPQEMARRAALVAITNYMSAVDVFKSDGNTLDVSKFHSYSDTSGNFFDYYLGVKSWGEWSAKDEDTWQVENLTYINCFGSEKRASLNVRYNGEQYVISNAVITFGKSNDPNKSGLSEYDDEFTVAPKLIKDDRNNNRLDSYYSWVMNQFSSWDASHKGLREMVKKNLNDENSFKHIKTDYTMIYSEEVKANYNKMLKTANKTARVEIGDVWLSMEFSAKNVFNATVTSKAFAISSFTKNTLILVAIE